MAAPTLVSRSVSRSAPGLGGSAAPRAALRVAVATNISLFSPYTGVGKVWNRSLRALMAAGVRIDFVRPGSLRTRWRRPDVWLFDGHLGPLDVPGPSVAVLQEAPWSDPALRAMLTPAWVERLGPPSEASAEAATVVVTPSTSSAQQLRAAGVPAEKVRVVPLGVDRTTFRPTRLAHGAALAREAGIDSPFVLVVATVHPRKNLGALREAMAGLADRGFPDGLVMVLGESPDVTDGTSRARETATALGDHRGRVAVVTDIEELDVAALMSAASAFCLPSLMEGFGLPVLEAMACATPVVVSNRGSLPEVVGDAGLVVEPTAQAIEEALAEVLGDPDRAADLAEAGLRRAKQLPWEATAHGWWAALERAASG